MPKLYCIRNKLNEHSYVGYTTRSDVSIRAEEHFKFAKYNDTAFSRAIQKYGRENFEVVELYEGADALKKEDGFVQLMGHYNMTSGGGVPPPQKGRKQPSRTEEYKEQITKRQIGKPSGMLGKRHSEETKMKISLKQKGRPLSEEHKRALRKPKSTPVWNKGLTIKRVE